jgi:hypothetical protein
MTGARKNSNQSLNLHENQWRWRKSRQNFSDARRERDDEKPSGAPNRKWNPIGRGKWWKITYGAFRSDELVTRAPHATEDSPLQALVREVLKAQLVGGVETAGLPMRAAGALEASNSTIAVPLARQHAPDRQSGAGVLELSQANPQTGTIEVTIAADS